LCGKEMCFFFKYGPQKTWTVSVGQGGGRPSSEAWGSFLPVVLQQNCVTSCWTYLNTPAESCQSTFFFPSLSRRSRSPPRNSISHQFTLELLLSLVRKTQRAWLIFICCVFAFPLSLHPLCHFTPFVLFLPWDIILLGPTHSFRPILTSIPIPVLQPPRVSLFHLSPHSSLITCATRL